MIGKLTIQEIKTYYNEHPLRVIIFAGVLFRLIAAIFSKGYGWHDDQFLIVEVAQSWVSGVDYYGWLPDAIGNGTPKGFSFFYVGLHYLLFSSLEFLGISDPNAKMLIVRILHGAWSMLIIYYGYLITKKLGSKKDAILVGWLLALFWIFPMISVRNLVEFVCIPPLMYGLWVIVSSNDKTKLSRWLWAGIVLGIAFNIRFQTGLIIGAMGIVILFRKQIKETFTLGIGVLLSIIVFQGGIDYLVWKEPFLQLIHYVTYNSDGSNISGYPQGPWYAYILFLLGVLIPPVSVFILTGFFKEWKRLAIIFVPVLLFLIFHSYYPNKQERFVITIIPMLFIIGVIGWNQIITRSSAAKFITFSKGSWVFFWIVNIILLIPISMMYSKKARVESMLYLNEYENINNFMIEDVNHNVLRFPPQYYLGEFYEYHVYNKSTVFKEFRDDRLSDSSKMIPGFILFYQPDSIESRVERIKRIYPNLEYETTIEPGTMDRVLHWLNPINANQKIYIYRNMDVIPKGKSD